MKKILILSFIAIIFMACGGDDISNDKTIEEEKDFGCVDIYTEAYIKSKFSDVQKIEYFPNMGACSYSIKTKTETYMTFYGVSKGSNESMLTQTLSYFSGAKALPELGENAYIYPVGGIQQITLLDNGNLITANIWLDSNNQFDKEKTIELIRDMNEKLK